MEEDDDNFLNGVIEFGDGRQYKVETSELHPNVDLYESHGMLSQEDEKSLSSDPVSKEERFVDDFDRSWPKAKGSPSTTGDLPLNATHMPSPTAHAHSPRDTSRVLFNERSNKLEPYTHAHRTGQGPFGGKRSSINEGSAMEHPRPTREGSHNIQVLRKPTGEFPRTRRFSSSSGGYSPASASSGHIGGHREGRRDGSDSSPRIARDQSLHSAEGHSNTRSSKGLPPVPPNAGHKSYNRQLPPHLSPTASTRRFSRDSQLYSPDAHQPGSLPPPATGHLPLQSPASTHASISPSVGPHAMLPPDAIDLDEVRKGVMHNAAERAKARRQQEEAEREAQRERARRKAAEIEEKMRAAEMEKAKQKEHENTATVVIVS